MADNYGWTFTDNRSIVGDYDSTSNDYDSTGNDYDSMSNDYDSASNDYDSTAIDNDSTARHSRSMLHIDAGTFQVSAGRQLVGDETVVAMEARPSGTRLRLRHRSGGMAVRPGEAVRRHICNRPVGPEGAEAAPVARRGERAETRGERGCWLEL